jgi:hypothetical protein
VLYSEQQNNAAWTKAGATITANATASPDGYTNADKVVEDTSGGGTHGTYQSASVTSGTTYTWSGFFKAAERTAVEVSAQTSGTYNAKFNLSNGTVISVDSGATASVVNYGNGWYRCIISAPTASTTAFFNWWMLNSSNQGVYTGNGTSGVFAWGCQLEAGAYATSYIPTLGTSVTRVADECNKTSVSSLIGQTEGTLFAEFYWDGNPIENWLLSVQTSASNFVAMFLLDDGRPYFYILNSGSVQMAYIGTALSVGYHKFAFGYAANNSVAYIDGVLKSTDTSCTIPATSEVRIGSVQTPVTQAATIKQAIVFPTRLSNSDLAALTA